MKRLDSPPSQAASASSTDAAQGVDADSMETVSREPLPHANGRVPVGVMTCCGGAEPLWSIGELATELGVTTRTIRFYESRGLIAPEREKGARVYGRRDRARMHLILRGKNLGFTLEDIREYLSLYDADTNQVAQTQLLLQKVEGSIAELEQKKVDLERTLVELKGLKARATEFLAARKA